MLERFAAELGEGRRAREIARTTDDEPLLRDLALVTERPVLFVLNIRRGAPRRRRGAGRLGARARRRQVVALAARLEVELAELEPDEAAEFRAELGVPAGGVDERDRRLLRRAGLHHLLHRRLQVEREPRLAAAARLDRLAGRRPHPRRHPEEVRARRGRADRRALHVLGRSPTPATRACCASRAETTWSPTATS